jgi:hypothetical protein
MSEYLPTLGNHARIPLQRFSKSTDNLTEYTQFTTKTRTLKMRIGSEGLRNVRIGCAWLEFEPVTAIIRTKRIAESTFAVRVCVFKVPTCRYETLRICFHYQDGCHAVGCVKVSSAKLYADSAKAVFRDLPPPPPRSTEICQRHMTPQTLASWKCSTKLYMATNMNLHTNSCPMLY